MLDLVFKLLFEDKRLLRPMLQAVLGLKNIEDIEIRNPGITGETVTDKYIVLDLTVRLSDGTLIDIEAQGAARPGLGGRLLFYWARLYAGQIEAGEDYRGLRPARVICWLDAKMIANDEFHNVYGLRNRKDGRDWIPDDLAIHVLELPKLSLRPTTSEVAVRRWARFLIASTREELDDLAKEDPETMSLAKNRLEELSADAEVVARAREREKNLVALGHWAASERAEGREEGRQVGREEGRQVGREEGRRLGLANNLVRLIQKRLGEISPAVHHQIESATELELARWTERLFDASTIEEVMAADE
jgi:predicted transposase/invertase (TIGR01784 family)